MRRSDIAENLGARANQGAATNLRVAVPGLVAGPSERHLLQYRDVVVEDGSSADDEAGGMAEEDTPTERHSRMDIGLKNLGRAALKVEREIGSAIVPQPIGKPVCLDRSESLGIEKRLDEPAAARVTVDDGSDVSAECLADRCIAGHGPCQRIGDQRLGYRAVCETRGNPVNNRLLERIAIEDRLEQQRRQARGGGKNVLRVFADTRPQQMVDFVCWRMGWVLVSRLVACHALPLSEAACGSKNVVIEITSGCEEAKAAPVMRHNLGFSLAGCDDVGVVQ